MFMGKWMRTSTVAGVGKVERMAQILRIFFKEHTTNRNETLVAFG